MNCDRCLAFCTETEAAPPYLAKTILLHQFCSQFWIVEISNTDMLLTPHWDPSISFTTLPSGPPLVIITMLTPAFYQVKLVGRPCLKGVITAGPDNTLLENCHVIYHPCCSGTPYLTRSSDWFNALQVPNQSWSTKDCLCCLCCYIVT